MDFDEQIENHYFPNNSKFKINFSVDCDQVIQSKETHEIFDWSELYLRNSKQSVASIPPLASRGSIYHESTRSALFTSERYLRTKLKLSAWRSELLSTDALYQLCINFM